MFTGNDDLDEKLKNMFRLGVVQTINPAAGTARVRFPDDDDFISFDLQVLHRNTYRNKDYNMPDVGEDVLCMFLASGMAEGFILGSIYAGDRVPPEMTEDKRTVIFADGSRFSYDRKTRQMDITIGPTTIMANTQSVIVNTPVSVDVTSGETITATAGKTITANAGESIIATAVQSISATAGQSVTVNTPGIVQIAAAGGAQITAPKITLDGNVQVNGIVQTTGDVIANATSLQGHTHTGNQGKPTSSPN